jgi:hypothetical protein
VSKAMRAVACRRPAAAGRIGRGLALVAAMGLTLAGCATVSGHPSATSYPTIPEPTATATVYATATPDLSYLAAWTRVSSANLGASSGPAGLRTQYDTFAGQTSKTSAPEFRLRRSDDFGKTWVNLTPPQIPGVSYPASVFFISATMSPLNPKVVILTLQLGNVTCPQASGQKGRSCQVQYVSLDGGATWRLLALPAAGLLAVFNTLGSDLPSNLSAQGTRLYGVINDGLLAASGVIPPGRLVASDDGGPTWRLADATLAAHNPWIYNYAAAPGGSTIFALVGPTDPFAISDGLPPLALWRSDDAGASWKAAGALPARDQGAMLAGYDAATGQTLLYLIAGDSYNAPRLFASRDGGAHWTMCSEQSSTAPTLLGALPDGSILLDTASAVEAWDGSASAPRPVAQRSGLSSGASATLQQQTDGSIRVWLIGGDAQGAVYEYTTLKP